MKFARSSKADVEVNLTPLIDVVFLLLIFFMVSTTFTKETHLSIDLPEASGEPGQVAPQQVEVTITANGDYAVGGEAVVNTDIETLKSAINQKSGGVSTMPLVISADSATPHQAVVRAMDAAGQLGFVHLSITTRNAEDE